MFDWLYGLFDSLVDFFIGIYQGIIDFITGVLDYLFQFAFGFLPQSVQDGSAFGMDFSTLDILHDPSQGGMQNSLWTGLLWLFPFSECLLICIGAYILVAGIRLLRWLVGLIPTMSLG